VFLFESAWQGQDQSVIFAISAEFIITPSPLARPAGAVGRPFGGGACVPGPVAAIFGMSPVFSLFAGP
jgi:hypothetical protein